MQGSISNRLRSLPWLRWLGEFVVIVLGILGAFAVDEYREAERDREVANEYLQQLVQDLVRDRHQMVNTQRRIHGELLAADQVLLLLGADLNGYWNEVPFYSSPTLESFAPDQIRINELGEFDLFHPYVSTYSSIVSNGDLRTIADPTLRRAIVSYYEEVARRQRDQEEFLIDATRLKDLLLSHNIDLHQSDQLDDILAIRGLLPVLSAARDSSHWRLARLYIMKLHQQTLMKTLLESGRLSSASTGALEDVLYLTEENLDRPIDFDWEALVPPEA